MTIQQHHIKTRFLVLSDTHGLEAVAKDSPTHSVDVVIHCGDLTTESKLEEYKASIRLLHTIDAPLKLVIAGNHDFTLDIPTFRRKVADIRPTLDPTLVQQIYGYEGEARELFDREVGITFLDEGTHGFRLENGATLRVYASPYTPSLGGWAFQYHPDQGHDFAIHSVDVAITHGPPRGIMDMTYSSERAGCPFLFEAIARARPRMHCFGHIHEGWGAKLITWRQKPSAKPSHLTDIDNERSRTIAKLSQMLKEVTQAPSGILTTNHCYSDRNPVEMGLQTVFVNAAIEGEEDLPIQPPWIVELDLPPAR